SDLFAHISTCAIFFYGSGVPQDLHSFPTRRSSDLLYNEWEFAETVLKSGGYVSDLCVIALDGETVVGYNALTKARIGDQTGLVRSEEHTSELQSRFDLVCRLLLEKKKKARKRRCSD